MRIDSLRTFLVLAKNNCNFSIHTVLGISRSTMWSHITEIEREVGTKLVNRRKQNTSFTEEGLLFILYAEKMYSYFEDSIALMRSKQGKGIPGEIIISTTKAVSEGWLLPGTSDFSRQYPEINLTIVAEDYLSRKLHNTADILIRPVGDLSGIKKMWCTICAHGLFASRTYLESHGTPKAPSDLVHHRLIAYGEQPFSGFDEINWHLKGKFGNLPKLIPALSINSTTAIYRAACEGLGVVACPIESNIILNGGLIRILPEITGPIVETFFGVREGLSAHKNNNISLFQAYLEKYLSALGVEIHYETT